tara:strand:- start:191 stop:685 length:495 start_codon:yes stop_codon:yes gene_type:complete
LAQAGDSKRDWSVTGQQRRINNMSLREEIGRFFAAVVSGFKHYFIFRGTASRPEFWHFSLFFVLLYITVATLDQLALTPVAKISEFPFFGHLIPMGYVDDEVGYLVLLYRPFMMLPTISVTIRRLRDVGKSGWHTLLWILPLPIVGWFWLLPLLMRPSIIKNKT